MATKYINSISDGTNTYKFVDDSSGYVKSSGVTDVKVDNASVVTSNVANLKTSTSHPYNASTNVLATLADIEAAGGANDGVLKLQKDTGTATSLFSANQAGDSTLKFTTTSVGSASGWSAGTMASIDTSKFSGGSFTQGTDSFTKPTHGSDSFTAATLTSSVGSTTTSAANPTTLTISFTGGSYTQGTFTQGSFTQGTDSHTAASLGTGFYSAGSVPSLTVTSTTVVNDISKAS